MAIFYKLCVIILLLTTAVHPSHLVAAVRAAGEQQIARKAAEAAEAIPRTALIAARRLHTFALRPAPAWPSSAQRLGVAALGSRAPSSAGFHVAAVNKSVIYPDLTDDEANNRLLRLHGDIVRSDATAAEFAALAKEAAQMAVQVFEPLVAGAPESRRDYANRMLRQINSAAELSFIGAASVERLSPRANTAHNGVNGFTNFLDDLVKAQSQAREGAAQAIDWTLHARKYLTVMRMYDDTKGYILDPDSHTPQETTPLEKLHGSDAEDAGLFAGRFGDDRKRAGALRDWVKLEHCLAHATDKLIRVAYFELHLADRVSRREKHTVEDWSKLVRRAVRDVCASDDLGYLELFERKTGFR